MASDAFDALTAEEQLEIMAQFSRAMVDVPQMLVGFDAARRDGLAMFRFSRCEDPNSFDPEAPVTIRYERCWMIEKPVVDRAVEAAGFEFVRREVQTFGPAGAQRLRVWKLKDGGEG